MKIYRLLLLLLPSSHALHNPFLIASVLCLLVASAAVLLALALSKTGRQFGRAAVLLGVCLAVSGWQTHIFPALDTNNLWTGTNTFASINKVIKVDQLAGATADVKLSACFAALASAGGGMCDARGFGPTTQTISASVTIGDGINLYSLICDHATKFIPGSASLVMIKAKQGSTIDGCRFNTTGQTFTGAVLQYGSLTRSADPGPYNQQSPDMYGCSNTPAAAQPGCLLTSAYNIEIDGNWVDTTGHGIDLLASNANTAFTQFLSFANIQVTGLTCVNLQTQVGGTGFINGNQFYGLHCNSKQGILFNSANTVNTQIAANTFTDYQYEGLSDAAAVCINATGGGFVNRNQFVSASCWDIPTTAIDFSGSTKYQNNQFIGSLNGAATLFKQNAGSPTNIYQDSGNSVLLNTSGWQNDWIAQRFLANGGVSGQGAILSRSGSTGTAVLTSALAVSGTTVAVAIQDSNGNNVLNTLGNSNVTISNIVSSYDGATTAGNGLASVNGATSQKAESAADASVLSVTPVAAAGSYRLRIVISLSAATAATIGWTATWKDSNAAAQTPTNLSLYQSGTAAPALTFTTSAAGNYYGEAMVDVDNSTTAIVIKLTFSGTSFAGKVSATVERII